MFNGRTCKIFMSKFYDANVMYSFGINKLNCLMCCYGFNYVMECTPCLSIIVPFRNWSFIWYIRLFPLSKSLQFNEISVGYKIIAHWFICDIPLEALQMYIIVFRKWLLIVDWLTYVNWHWGFLWSLWCEFLFVISYLLMI